MVQKSIRKSFFFYIFIAIVAVALSSCATVPHIQSTEEEDALYPPQSYIPGSFDWEPVCGGIARADVTSGGVSYTVIRIDLSQPGLDLCAYPGGGTEVSADASYPARRVRDFARETGCAVAFNTAPFSDGVPPEIRGIHVADGTAYSPETARYAALTLSRHDGGGWTAGIMRTQEGALAQDADFIFGGFFAVLEDGERMQFARHSYEARTGAGVTADGRTLFVMLVRQGGGIRGLSYQQCALVFRALGCTDALEFDGGHSAELYVMGQALTGTQVTRRQAAMAGFVLDQPL